VEGGGGSLVE
jgi:hypothetical protein